MGISDDIMDAVTEAAQEALDEEMEKYVGQLIADGYRGPVFSWKGSEDGETTYHFSTDPPPDGTADVNRAEITDEVAAEYLAEKKD